MRKSSAEVLAKIEAAKEFMNWFWPELDDGWVRKYRKYLKDQEEGLRQSREIWGAR